MFTVASKLSWWLRSFSASGSRQLNRHFRLLSFTACDRPGGRCLCQTLSVPITALLALMLPPTGLLISLSITCPLLFGLSFNRQSPHCLRRPLMPTQPLPLSLTSLRYISRVLSLYFISSQVLLSSPQPILLQSLRSCKVSRYIAGELRFPAPPAGPAICC